MAVNKVKLSNGTTLIDITDSSVTAETLKNGEIAYGADGIRIIGEMISGDYNVHSEINADDTQNLIIEDASEGGGSPDIGVEPLNVTANGAYTAEEGFAYNPVTVNVQPKLQSKTVTQNGTVTPDSGFDGLSSVLVNIATSAVKIVTGTDTINTDFTTTRRTVTHNLGVVPDLVFYFATANVAQTYSMLWAIRSTFMGYRSSAYNNYMGYHGNSTTTVTMTNSNSTTYGVSNLTATTFQLASSSSSYYWRAGTYRWFAIKF